jgi:glycosyltransferase involved in cell wall biosynthesis
MVPKKKLVVIGPCYPYRGGIATFVAHLCKGLSQNFDVSLINYSLLYPSILFPGKTQYDESKTLTFDFPNRRLLNSINPFSWIKVARAIKAEKPDLIIMDWWNPFFALCFKGVFTFLNRDYKNKILVIAENVVSHEGRKIDAALTKMGISIASEYLVLSDKVAEEIKPYSNNKKIYKAHLPIYNTFNKGENVSTKKGLGYSEDDYVLLFFGYVRKYKGLDIALEAFPEIKKSIPNAKLLVVGECYDEWKEYQDLIEKYHLQQDVKVVSEYVPNEAVGGYFNACDLVLLPYRTATQSGILNIAYGFNKPVVATNVGGFSEFIKDGSSGLLVQKVDAPAFAQGVIKWHEQHRNDDYITAISDVVTANGFGKINGIIETILASK